MLNGGGNGTLGAIGNLLGAKLTGESIFLVRYINKCNKPRKVAFGGSFGLHPVKILNESLICNRGVYVASNNLVQVSAKISIAGIVSGMGGLLQKYQGHQLCFWTARDNQ